MSGEDVISHSPPWPRARSRITVRPRWPSSTPGAVAGSKPQPSSRDGQRRAGRRWRRSRSRRCVACACASALASASETIRAASVTASGPASPWPQTRTGGLRRSAAASIACAQVGGRVRRRAPAGARGRAGGRRRRPRSGASRSGSGSASSRRATARYCASPSWTSAASVRRSRSIAACSSSRRSRAVVMPGGELQAEQAQHGPAQRVDPDRRGARWRSRRRPSRARR